MKRWVIGEADNDLAADIAQKCDLTPLCIKVLLSRGCKDLDDIAAFFDTAPLEDPFVLRDMQEAVDTINKAIESFDLICVCGCALQLSRLLRRERYVLYTRERRGLRS